MAKNQVIVSILGNTRDLQAKLGGAIGTAGKFAAAATAAGAAAAVALGVKAVRSASDLEQAMGGMEAVFKGNAAQMTQWATDAAGSVGLAKSEYATLATVLGSQMKNMGVSTDELGGKTNELIGLGADLAAQFGGSSSEAVSALSSLLRGERDPIERYGVSINEAAVKAKLAEMGLAGLSGEAEKNAKLSATLALLYDQTADAQGAFARESTTLAGAQQRLAAGSENLYATLGTSLLPAVTAVTAGFGEMVNRLGGSEWFTNLTANLTEASNKFADFIFGMLNGTESLDFGALMDGLLPAITNGIQSAAAWLADGGITTIVTALSTGRDALLQGALTTFTALAEALPTIVPLVLEALLTLVTELIGFILESAPLILESAVTLFTGLIEGVAQILPDLLDAIIELLPKIATTILEMIPTLLDAAVKIFTTLIDSLPIILPKLVVALVGLLPVLITTIVSLIPRLLSAAIELFTALITSLPIILPNLIIELIAMAPQLVQTIVGLLPTILDAAVQLFTALVTAIPTIVTKLLPALRDLGPRMVSTIRDMIPQMLAAGGDLVQGLADGLWRSAGNVASNMLNIAKNALNSFKNFLGIRSPSRVFRQMGGYITEGLGDGLRGTLGTVKGAVRAVNDAVTDTFDAQLDAGTVNLAAGGTYGTTADTTGPRTYNITIQAVTASAEVGRAVVQAIRAYEGAAGGAGQ